MKKRIFTFIVSCAFCITLFECLSTISSYAFEITWGDLFEWHNSSMDKINGLNALDDLVGTKWFTSGGGGSHGGSGSSRDPYIIDEQPISVPQPIVNKNYNTSTHNYDYSVYNFSNDSYDLTNNFDYSQTYNYYYTSSDTYNYAFQFETNYYTIAISPMSSPNDFEYYKVYYELPDGRSSYDLTPEDINGVIFNYDVLNYNRTPLDSSVCAIFHFDGDFHSSMDTSEHSTSYFSSSLDFERGMFDGAYKFPNQYYNYSYPLQLNDIPLGGSVWSLDFWLYVPERVPTSIFGFKGSAENNNVIPFDMGVPGDAWYNVVYRSDGTLFVNGEQKNSGSLFSTYLFDFITVYSGNNATILFHGGIGDNVSRDSQNIGGVSYRQVMMGNLIDELVVYNTLITPSSTSLRLQPHDFNFAYTIPNNVITYEQKFDSEHYSVNADFVDYINPGSTVSHSYFFTSPYIFNMSDFLDSSSNYGVYFYFPNRSYFYRPSMSNISWYVNTYPNTYFSQHYLDDDFHFAFNVRYLENTNGSAEVYFGIRYFDDENKLKLADFNYWSYSSHTNNFSNHLTDNFFDFTFDVTGFNYFTTFSSVSSPIAIQSPYNVGSWQIGGIRKTNPSVGDLYISLFDNHASSIQMYYHGVWNDVNGAIYHNGKWNDLKNWDFEKLMISGGNGSSSGTTNYYIYNYGGSSETNITNNGSSIDITITPNGDEGNTLTQFFTFLPLALGTIKGWFLALTFLPSGFLVGVPFALSVVLALIVFKIFKR